MMTPEERVARFNAAVAEAVEAEAACTAALARAADLAGLPGEEQCRRLAGAETAIGAVADAVERVLLELMAAYQAATPGERLLMCRPVAEYQAAAKKLLAELAKSWELIQSLWDR
jgi:hypothetical protein